MSELEDNLHYLMELSTEDSAFRKSMPTAQRDLEYREEPKQEEKEEKPKKEVKEKKELDKNTLIKIGLIVTGIILIFLIFSFLFKGEEKPPVNENPTPTIVINNNVNNDSSTTPINPNNNQVSAEAYLNIKSVLDVSVNNEILSVELISDLEKDTIIKLGIFNGSTEIYEFIKVDENGKANMKYTIPATWGEETITVGAYLKFEDAEFSQPSNVVQKYGDRGQYIIWNTEYPKSLITYSTVTHSNDLVIALKKQREEQRAQELMNKIEKDFKSIDTRVDSFGNIKHVPKGYSFDETNVSENINIYPMIFYDKANNKSQLYIVCGFVGTQYLRFETVGFSADGYNWTYDKSTNVYKIETVGNKKAEWIYFNNIDTPALLGDMEVFANSKDVTLSLIGSINKKYKISTKQLNDIKNFLYIYETYYGNGTSVPDTSWFNMNGQTVSLAYIQKPDSMYQRGYREINSLKDYSDGLSQKRLNGIIVTEEETNLLSQMNRTYRVSSESIINKVYDSIIDSKAIALYYDDYETNKKYMKLYFNYDDENYDIESGYIPYVNIYEDYTIIVPIKTITAQTTSYDKVYAQYKISEILYEELSLYYNGKQYEEVK